MLAPFLDRDQLSFFADVHVPGIYAHKHDLLVHRSVERHDPVSHLLILFPNNVRKRKFNVVNYPFETDVKDIVDICNYAAILGHQA